MFNFRVTSKTFALLALFTLLMSAFGCNTGKVIAPEPTPERIFTDPAAISILSTPKNVSQPSLASAVSTVVSADNGGVVANRFVSLEFPPGALNEDTEITIEMPDPSKMIFEFGPHGIQFNKPVVMTVDLTRTNAVGMADETITLWFNEEMGWWEPVEKIESGGPNEPRSALEHFSKYGECPGY
jgi:hypothetical protein